MAKNLHDQDFFAWTQQQAEILRTGRLGDADIEHLIEELESMGASERRELINRLALLMAHLLKWQFQPSFRGRSWQLTIKERRRQVERLLKDNPSLNARFPEFVEDAYIDAVLLAAKETGLEESVFPGRCAYACSDLLCVDFYPASIPPDCFTP